MKLLALVKIVVQFTSTFLRFQSQSIFPTHLMYMSPAVRFSPNEDIGDLYREGPFSENSPMNVEHQTETTVTLDCQVAQVVFLVDI